MGQCLPPPPNLSNLSLKLALKDFSFVANMSRTECLNLVSIWNLFDICWEQIETCLTPEFIVYCYPVVTTTGRNPKELVSDHIGTRPTVTKAGGHHILEVEVVKALNSMSTGKAAGPDRVLTEMILALEDFRIAKITHAEGSFPTEMCKSIFITLPTKPATIEYDHHPTISLMSHMAHKRLFLGWGWRQSGQLKCNKILK